MNRELLQKLLDIAQSRPKRESQTDSTNCLIFGQAAHLFSDLSDRSLSKTLGISYNDTACLSGCMSLASKITLLKKLLASNEEVMAKGFSKGDRVSECKGDTESDSDLVVHFSDAQYTLVVDGRGECSAYDTSELYPISRHAIGDILEEATVVSVNDDGTYTVKL